jgi:cytosine/adenosine deaminase-related metal-dependent hydrolase
VRRQYIPGSDGVLTLALAASGPLFGTVDVAEREWRVAREVGARISTHAGVGPASRGNLARFAAKGLLGPDTTYIHCNYFDAEEWRLVAGSGGTVSISPQIELQMGHGNPAVQGALDAGLGASLSVDAETSVPSDMFTQMRAALASQRGEGNARAHRKEPGAPPLLTAREVLRFATMDGARANGLDSQVGSLRPDKQADIVLLRADRINVMPVNDPIGAVVTGMDTSNVDTVMVAGTVRKWHGALVGVDLNRMSDLVARSRRSVLASL